MWDLEINFQFVENFDLVLIGDKTSFDLLVS
jgi:hypothetical protein